MGEWAWHALFCLVQNCDLYLLPVLMHCHVSGVPTTYLYACTNAEIQKISICIGTIWSTPVPTFTTTIKIGGTLWCLLSSSIFSSRAFYISDLARITLCEYWISSIRLLSIHDI